MRFVAMSASARRLAHAALAALLFVGCAAEEADERANYPPTPGTDSPEEMATAQRARAPDPVMGDDPTLADDSYADDDPSALTDFHDALDAHGQWVDDPNYGTMWQPSPGEVGSDFAPYVSDGHWAYDDADEYVWMSDYGWGWAPFHYGRWTYGTFGWGWIPGRAYAPAWVSWRTGYSGFGYVGWAPLAPTWGWRAGGATFRFAAVPATPYAFCGVHDVFATRGLSARLVTSPSAVQAIAGQTHPYAPSGTGMPGGRVPAHPSVAGPSPASLRLSPSEVARVPSGDPQVAKATQFSRPSTALRLGGHAPASAHSVARIPSSSGAAAGHALLGRGSMPAYGAPARVYSTGQLDGSHVSGSYYGHGGSYRSYGAPSRPSEGGTVAHPTVSPPSAPSHSSTGGSGGHFGGHYGGGAHGGGGHR
jgi:hypothetical protein